MHLMIEVVEGVPLLSDAAAAAVVAAVVAVVVTALVCSIVLDRHHHRYSSFFELPLLTEWSLWKRAMMKKRME